MSSWFLYIIRAADNSLYTGITTDVARRFAEHSEGGKLAARYLRGRAPLTLCFQHDIGTRAKALKAEYRFKQLAKTEKERLLSTPTQLAEFLDS